MQKKVCFVASSGGHLEEISRLKEIASLYDSFLVTEKSDFKIEGFCEKCYPIWQMNRKEILFGVAFRILSKEKPEFIITTGALAAYPFCIIGKYYGSKIIYIESFARVKKPSLTGRLLYNFADLFIVQWEDMLELYPKSVLGGGIL